MNDFFNSEDYTIDFFCLKELEEKVSFLKELDEFNDKLFKAVLDFNCIEYEEFVGETGVLIDADKLEPYQIKAIKDYNKFIQFEGLYRMAGVKPLDEK